MAVTFARRATALASRLKTIALSQVPITGQFPQITKTLHTTQFSSFAEFLKWQEANAQRIDGWEREDKQFIPEDEPAFTISGFCVLCDVAVDFEATTEVNRLNSAGEVVPNYRELLTCPRCRMCNRIRAALHVAIQDLGVTADTHIYTTEQLGRVYRWLRGHFHYVQGSEYLSPDKTPGTRTMGITHEDAQALSLPTASLDCILSFDVLEHVPDHIAAFASFARVLRPGGRLIMTVPLNLDKYETTVRAVMHDGGRIEHLLPIEIHGNPLDPLGGSLSFRTFGWDTLEQLGEAGFADPSLVVYHDRELGHLGGLQAFFTAVR